MSLSRIPGVLPSGTRRRVPKASQNRKVPLWTVEPDGELFEGRVRVPTSLSYTQPHTNERLRFTAYMNHHIERWVDWRKAKGWILTGDLTVEGPQDVDDTDRAVKYAEHVIKNIGKVGNAAFAGAFDEGDDYTFFWVRGRFKRETPLYFPLDDMLEFRHMALLHGVDPDRDKPLVTPLPEPKDHLEFQGGLDPLKVAEERRQAKGIKRKDYQFGPLWRPL